MIKFVGKGTVCGTRGIVFEGGLLARPVEIPVAKSYHHKTKDIIHDTHESLAVTASTLAHACTAHRLVAMGPNAYRYGVLA